MHVYKKHEIEVPDSTFNQWVQYRKGFKNVRAKRVEEGNCMKQLLFELFFFIYLNYFDDGTVADAVYD